jgi:biotin carboxyl carrier protein
MAVNEDRLLRVTILGVTPLVFELDPAELAPATVRPGTVALQPSAAERAAGQHRYEVVVDGWVFHALIEPAARARLRERASRSGDAATAGPRIVLRAQIPGRIVRVWAAPGDAIEAGQRLLAVEAMKMENEVCAPRAGTVEAVTAAVGQTVELGDELVTIG